MKKSALRGVILSILMLLSLFRYVPDVAQAAEFQIAASDNDVLLYRINLDGNVSYAKFAINKTIENTTAIVICYNAFFGDYVSQLDDNETDVEYVNSTLTGSITEDLFGSMTVLNMILPLGTNFTASENALQRSFDEMDGIEIELSTYISGFAIKLQFFLRVVLLVKIVEFTYYYSTTGILLLGQTYFKDPRSGDESYGSFEIIPELSTVPGVEEDPLHPELNAGTENQTSPGTFGDDNQSLKLDFQGILTIVLGTGMLGGIITGIVVLVKKKKKRAQAPL